VKKKRTVDGNSILCGKKKRGTNTKKHKNNKTQPSILFIIPDSILSVSREKRATDQPKERIMPEKEKKSKKLKKEKKEKEEKEDVQQYDVTTAESGMMPPKEKKSKKRKAEKIDFAEIIETEVDCVNAPVSAKKAKTMVVESAMPELEPEPEPEPDATSEPALTLNWPKQQGGGDSDAATEEKTKDIKKHEAQLKNKLPTRQEKQRRDNQKKMQAFVAEMRAKGKTKEEINKLKKKVNAKLKHIQPNQEFSSVVSLGDIQLSCRECHAEFTFSVQEQQFYTEKQYPPPVRCKECTAAKKVRMAGFDKKDAWSAGGGSGGYQGYSNNNNSVYAGNSSSYSERGSSSYGGSGGGGGKGGGARSNWGNI
jgi:hypothetical protein